DANTKGSCRETLNSMLFNNLQLSEKQVVFFDGASQNLTTECERINMAIECSGGLDLIILGIGMNGHLGFNEPNIITEEASIVALAEVTKSVMGKYFDDELQLTHGITLGYNQILSAKDLILMASGSSKNEIINKVLKSDPSYDIPATMLKTNNNSKLYVDVDAIGGSNGKSIY
ncbi:MAG: 6-phosphogluconolactonase, partial [Erysipelotrichaceae bacterium]